MVQTLKYRDGCDRRRKSVCDIESPEKRLLEKEVSTWRGFFVFPMMKEGILQTNKSQICLIWNSRISIVLTTNQSVHSQIYKKYEKFHYRKKNIQVYIRTFSLDQKNKYISQDIPK